MKTVVRYGAQVLVYGLIAVVIGYFANAPSYSTVPPGQAQIKFSLAHGAESKGGCRELTEEERAKLAPNMRRTRICSRERLPVAVELEANGELLYADTLQPAGLHGDGPSQTFRRFVVEPGRYVLVARLRETDRAEGFDHVTERVVDLRPGQSLAIDFKSTGRQFVFE